MNKHNMRRHMGTKHSHTKVDENQHIPSEESVECNDLDEALEVWKIYKLLQRMNYKNIIYCSFFVTTCIFSKLQVLHPNHYIPLILWKEYVDYYPLLCENVLFPYLCSYYVYPYVSH